MSISFRDKKSDDGLWPSSLLDFIFYINRYLNVAVAAKNTRATVPASVAAPTFVSFMKKKEKLRIPNKQAIA